MYRLKERVKRGDLTPEDALKFIAENFVGVPPKRLVQWLRVTGPVRYRQARKEQSD